MKIINKCLRKKKFEKYIGKKKVARKIDKIVLHHTSDTLRQWKKGEVSIGYYKKLYESKGWKAGPHLFVAPEGIYLFTDINIQGIHANSGNRGSIGVEMVGNYNKTLPSGKIWSNIKKVLRILMNKFNLKLKDIHLHREYNLKKSCPGRAITKKWIRTILEL
jgi:N-acetylmuramoyl-L-alanine amidase CwlA